MGRIDEPRAAGRVSRVEDIRRLVRRGEEFLAAVTTDDPDVLAAAFEAYNEQFSSVQAAAAREPLTEAEKRELVAVAEIHAAVEASVTRRAASTQELIGRLAKSGQLKAYAPVQQAARRSRYLDAAA